MPFTSSTTSVRPPLPTTISLEFLKTDPLFDPLPSEPRFKAVMRELNFPE